MLTIEMPSNRKDLVLQLLDSVLTTFEYEMPSRGELEDYVLHELEQMGADEGPLRILTTNSERQAASFPRSFVDPVSGGILVGALTAILHYVQSERHHKQNTEAGRSGGLNQDAEFYSCRYRMPNGHLCGEKLRSIKCEPATGVRQRYTEECTVDHQIEAFQPSEG